MDGLTLLRVAASVGLKVEVRGEKLVIRGPKRAEGLAKDILSNKGKVVAAIWRRRYEDHLKWQLAMEEKRSPFLSADERERRAASVAYGTVADMWRREHWTAPSGECCAGCGHEIGENDKEIIALADKARVHSLQCLVLYGDKWRGAAARGLALYGIAPIEAWA